MPLSKVRKLDRPPPTQRELDNKVGPGKAVCVLSLMNYDPKYDDLMKSYFGRTILCDTMETAKVLNAAPQFLCKSLIKRLIFIISRKLPIK